MVLTLTWPVAAGVALAGAPAPNPQAIEEADISTAQSCQIQRKDTGRDEVWRFTLSRCSRLSVFFSAGVTRLAHAEA